MKYRNGFVSNSSSSSFVVAFPNKPTSFSDVFEMMFHSKEGGIQPYDFIEGMSHVQVAERVWKDIKTEYEKGTKRDKYSDVFVPATEKDIIEHFYSRYHYYPNESNIHVLWTGRKNDELGGSWSQTVGKYFGSETETLNKLRDFVIKTEKEEKEISVRQREIYGRDFKVHCPPFAYKGGKDNKTGETYTQEQIKAYEAFNHAKDIFKKENKEYSILEKKRRSIWDKKWKTEETLRKKIAQADAKAFMKDNKKSFIAILSYADEDGETTLEHGDIFKNLPHATISHH